ncbi:vitamin B6 photo-protection and homoeostasis-domain-containing protein [Mycena sp. CBHHK59/15]|nr:vitamin B6 photo-protection and homoeostasis-domain-containing protein [Mycena sp. CBHHK59/15]
MVRAIIITELDESGRTHSNDTQLRGDEITARSTARNQRPIQIQVLDFVTKVFLPAGYPASVSPDYLRYQIFNALQAFCSSLAGLLSSRAILEGFGVGNAEASATHALLLTVLQDSFSRVTTILGAYIVGPSLSPEAKTFRIIADVSNDAAIILDTLSPLFDSPALPIKLPGARVAALCASGTLRAMCGIAAGGSKAALTAHFATPINGPGDIGDLNAKDSSKETVLALLGMLVGSMIVPYLTTPWTTYPVLFALVGLHLALNYVGIRGVVLRSLNRQRMSIVWDVYRESGDTKFASPTQASHIERIFQRPGLLRDHLTGRVAGHCTIGSSLTAILENHLIPLPLVESLKAESYILWFDRSCLSSRPGGADQLLPGPVRLHICLKQGYTTADQLKAWAHASEVGRMLLLQQRASFPLPDPAQLILAAHLRVDRVFADFLQGLRNVGWNTMDTALMPGSPRALVLSMEQADLEVMEEKKQK